MTHIRTWTVQLTITEDEFERTTRASAILHTDSRRPLRSEGRARRRPSDTEVPAIGDELAVARALASLTYQLLDATATDIEQFTHEPAGLTS
ncbi:DUF1876 domain-containing protein [Actinoplanes sp. KI2]|uniref:DUF1876 domain-containing protein n=1 Tax=Actinoplanes sp. KI2 TaxID=2983315 RepID=UPI0021D5D894|nr:DUF1876 domain-containing protein [Actinoplanes sp. KI2]MCU7729438.1 DUF1876 domain-containing protein [Actinoplanes sp. KI2]